jgi:hypothetical protein
MTKLIQFLFVFLLFSTVIFAEEKKLPEGSLNKYINTTWEYKKDDVTITVKFYDMHAEDDILAEIDFVDCKFGDCKLKANKLDYSGPTEDNGINKGQAVILFYEKDKSYSLFVAGEDCLLLADNEYVDENCFKKITPNNKVPGTN